MAEQQAAPAAAASMPGRWRANARAMQHRIRARLSVACAEQFSAFSFLRHQPGVAVAGWRGRRGASATSLVVARVFKGNVILARIARAPSPSGLSSSTQSLPGGSTSPSAAVSAAASAVALPSASTPSAIVSQPDPTLAAADSGVVRMLQAVALPFIGNVCHAFMHGLNRTQVIGAHKIQTAILERPPGQALITVSNHVASMDDPLVIASMLPPSIMMKASKLRWTLCATDRCFTNVASSAFFRCVKVLPLSRGAGVHQPGLDVALSKLRQGDWVHIFPEGSRSRDGGKTIGHVKRGIGRLVMDLDHVPMVVPFVHTGMQDVMPVGSKLPSIRKQVTVLVGDPIELDDLLRSGKEPGLLYDAIAQRVGKKLHELKAELDEMVLNNQMEEVHVFEKRGGLWEYVDWDNNGPLGDIALHRNEGRCPPLDNGRWPGESGRPLDPRSSIGDLRPSIDENSVLNAATAVDALTQQVSPSYRFRAFVDPASLVGFAARGFLTSRQSK